MATLQNADDVSSLLSSFTNLSCIEWKQLKAPFSPERVKRWLAAAETSSSPREKDKVCLSTTNLKADWVALPSCLLKPLAFRAQLQSAFLEKGWYYLTTWPLRKADARLLLPSDASHQYDFEGMPAFEWTFPYVWTLALRDEIRSLAPIAVLLHYARTQKAATSAAVGIPKMDSIRSHKANRKEKKRHATKRTDITRTDVTRTNVAQPSTMSDTDLSFPLYHHEHHHQEQEQEQQQQEQQDVRTETKHGVDEESEEASLLSLARAIGTDRDIPCRVIELVLIAYADELLATQPPDPMLDKAIKRSGDNDEEKECSLGTEELHPKITKLQTERTRALQHIKNSEGIFHQQWIRLHLFERGIAALPDQGLQAMLRAVWCKEEGPTFLNAFLSLLSVHFVDSSSRSDKNASGMHTESTLVHRKDPIVQLPDVWQLALKETETLMNATHAPLSLLSIAATCRSPCVSAGPSKRHHGVHHHQQQHQDHQSHQQQALRAVLCEETAMEHASPALYRQECKEMIQRLTFQMTRDDDTPEAVLHDSVPCPPPLVALQETLRAMLMTVSATVQGQGLLPVHRKQIKAILTSLQRHFNTEKMGKTIISMAQVVNASQGAHQHHQQAAAAAAAVAAERRREAAQVLLEMEEHHRVDKYGEKGEGKRLSKSAYRKAKDIEKGRKKKEKSRQKHGGHRAPVQDDPLVSPMKSFSAEKHPLKREIRRMDGGKEGEDEKEEEEESNEDDGDTNEEDEETEISRGMTCHNPNRSPTTDFYDFEGHHDQQFDAQQQQQRKKERQKRIVRYRKQSMSPEEAVDACRELWTLYGTFCENGGVWPFADPSLSPPSSALASKASRATAGKSAKSRDEGRRHSSSHPIASFDTVTSLEPLITQTLQVTAIGVGLTMHLLAATHGKQTPSKHARSAKDG